MGPAQRVDAVAVHQFARGAVGFVGVPNDVAFISDNAGDEFREFAMGRSSPVPTLTKAFAVVVFHQEQTRLGEVVDVEEFTAGRARAPAGHGRVRFTLASWNFRMRAGTTWLFCRS